MLAFISRLSRRLARLETLGWPTFWISALIYFGTTVLFDARRFGGPLWLWLVGWLLGQIVLALWALAFRYLLQRIRLASKKRALAMLATGIGAGLVRALALGCFSVITGLAATGQWGFRLPAGAIAGLVITVAGAALIGASLEHNEVMLALEITQKRLLEIRAKTPRTLAKARKDIATLAAKVLQPRLDELEQKLGSATAKATNLEPIAGEIRALIHEQVRPISSSLVAKVDRSLAVGKTEVPRPKRSLGLPRRFHVSSSLAPMVTFNLALLLCLATYATLTDRKTTAWAIAGSVALLVILQALARIFRPLPTINTIAGTVVLWAIGFVATMPMAVLTQWSLGRGNRLEAMFLQSTFIMSTLVVGIGYTKAVDAARREYENALERSNTEIERELGWIDVQLWVLRRDWSYLLHGKVQSALTAALARLTGGAAVDAKTLRLVKADVERARQALFLGIGQPFDLVSATQELVSSWQGICDVKITFTEAAARDLNDDLGLGRCVNEILRETVSNGVRHGNASEVSIEISCDENFVTLRAVNNGTPITAKRRKSLGTQMLDELTVSWSIASSRSETFFEAKLAKATSSFS